MVKVSVVIPVYNAQQYIERCMRCLLNQTLKEIEFIFVDDCSIDCSLTMLNQWQAKYPDVVRVLSAPANKGPGSARNLGIEQASGEYIGFMDVDDVIDETMYEKLYHEAAATDSDIVDCAYYEEISNQSVLAFTDDVTGLLDAAKISEIITGVGYAVSKIFRRELLQREDMKIREQVIYEDLDYLIHAVMLAKKIGNVKEILYIYKNNEQSISKKRNEQKKFDDMLLARNAIEQLNQREDLELAMQYAKINCILGALAICLSNQDNAEFALIDNLRRLKQMAQTDMAQWEDNPYIQKKMTEENRNLLLWFLGLNI